MKHNVLPTGFIIGVPNANILYEKHFFSSSLLHFMQGRKKDVSEYKKHLNLI